MNVPIWLPTLFVVGVVVMLLFLRFMEFCDKV